MRKIFAAALAALLLASAAYAQLPGGPGAQIPNSPGGGGSGSVTGITLIDTACGVSGGPITTTGTIQGAAVVRAVTGVTDTTLSTDCGKVVTVSNASPVTITLPQATGAFGAPFFYTQVNLGVGTATIVPTTSTINGATSLTLTTGQSGDIASDGTNYIAALGRGGSPTTNASDLTSGTLNAARLPAFTGDCTTSAGSAATTCTQPHPGYVVSNWYYGLGPIGQTTSAAAVANRILCTFQYFPRLVTIRNIGIGVVTAGSSNTQLAFYRNANGRPAALIDNTPSIANTAGATNITGALAADQQFGPGSANGREIWSCTNQNDSTVTYRAINNIYLAGAQYTGSATLGNILGSGSAVNTSIICSGAACNGGSSTFGTWPATLAGTTWSDSIGVTYAPIVAVQVVSSP